MIQTLTITICEVNSLHKISIIGSTFFLHIQRKNATGFFSYTQVLGKNKQHFNGRIWADWVFINLCDMQILIVKQNIIITYHRFS